MPAPAGNLRQAAFQALIRCSQKGRREAEKLPQAISGCKALDRRMPVPGLAELPERVGTNKILPVRSRLSDWFTGATR